MGLIRLKEDFQHKSQKSMSACISGLTLISIAQTDIGHLMRITECILYRYIT